ncbi:hypothetical protein vseg_015368 [Gypsophila vaccaria]
MEPTYFVFLLSVSLFSTGMAQERSPHGLDHQIPMALSPSTYEFFHPNDNHVHDPCATSNCSPLPLATQVPKMQSEEAESTTKTNALGAGVIAVATPAFAVLIMFCSAMSIYYLATTCRAKSSLTKSLAPDV